MTYVFRHHPKHLISRLIYIDDTKMTHQLLPSRHRYRFYYDVVFSSLSLSVRKFG